jgi:Na+-transporting NADH:ubiquinone oxidoreductase subunit A
MHGQIYNFASTKSKSMSKAISIRRGMNIKLKGEAEKVLQPVQVNGTFSISPANFHGVNPKLVVKEGDTVNAGDAVFFSKDDSRIMFTTPVSGKIEAVVRGEKRKILEVRIKADTNTAFKEFKKGDPKGMKKEDIIENLLSSGMWPFIRQIPFAVIANPSQTPKSIFISAFDSAPLAADNDFIMHGNGDEFQLGLDAIAKLTSGKVHLNVSGEQGQSKVFSNSKGVQINTVRGPHPAGNVGVQVHHIDPVNKGEVVWYLNPQDVLAIGRLFKNGTADFSKVVALTGPEAKNQKYFKTLPFSEVSSIITGNISDKNNRIVSGNVLSGTTVGKSGYVGFYDSQITVLEEGDQPQFFMTEGWMAPNFHKLSKSRTFFSWLTPNKKYALNTNFNGEERAFVMTGQYEEVFPFDIYPVQLLKAVITNDFEKMENLGIYEVTPEDFALCEFVCTSKIESQKIIREGLDLVRSES